MTETWAGTAAGIGKGTETKTDTETEIRADMDRDRDRYRDCIIIIFQSERGYKRNGGADTGDTERHIRAGWSTHLPR